MRIIAGKYRGAKLDAPEGLSTRPTLDRAKETLFNMIGYNLSGTKCLDLFAGSGQIGLEMLSRGADKVIFVENDAKAVKVINSNATKLRITADIMCSDVISALNVLSGQKFDIIYLDPPYKADVYNSVLVAVDKMQLLDNDGCVICESDNADALPHSVGKLINTKTKKVGTVYFSWYTIGELTD